MRRFPGVVTGIVRSKPDHQGRVVLEFPWLDRSYRSDPAPIASPMTGKKRGQYFMPEEDDEVLVAFEHGDFDHPFVVGFLWNGVDVPPDDDITPSVRRLRTVSGHVVEFDDRDGKERILIKTQGGQQIEMTDTPPIHIQIQTSNGNSVEISDTPPSINLSSSSGIVNIQAPLAQFSGTVMAPTIIATSVVSGSFNPTVGNIFGL